MKTIEYSKLSNADINIKLKGLEDEYETIKTKVAKQLQRMEELDKLFLEGKSELQKRGMKIK